MPAPSIPIQGWDRNDHARRVRRGDQMRLALACLLLAAAVAWIAVLKQRHVPAPVDCVAAPEPLVHREMQGPVPLAPGYGTQPPLKRRRTGGGRRDRRRRRARREGPPAIVINVARADDNGDGWRQIAREARQRAERAEMRHLELDRDLLAAQSERQELINKLAKGAEEALRLERQVSDTKAQGENLRLDDEAHRQHWQQMHDQMQEQRRRAEQAEVERDAAQARIVELLGEGQELRQTHAAAAAELNDIQCIAAQALRCEVPQEGSQPALTLVKNLRSALEKTERARDGWRGRALESERIRSLYAPGWTPVNGPHGRPCPGCQGCEPLMAHPMDLCSGSAWVAPAGCLGCAKAAGKTDGTECAIHGAAKEAISAPPGIRAKVDHEIPLTEMRRDVERLTRQRDEAKQAAQVALGSADRAAQALRAAQELAEVLRSQRDEAQALVQKVRDFADDEQKRAEFFQVEESKALDRVLTAEKERDEARAEVARLTQTQPVDDTPVRMTPAELLQRGGKWLGATREWLQWNRCHGNGESVQWGSEEEIRPPLKAREVEEIAAAAVATLWPVGAPPAVLDAARILTRWHYGADENHVRVLRAEWTALKAAVNSHPKVPDTAPLGATPDLPRAILLLASRPAPTHETIQRLCKWIGGIPFGETHRVLVDLCKAGRIVNRGLPDGYRLADEAAVHVAPLGTTPSGYEVSAESPAAPPAARLRSLLGHEPVRPVGWSADMWGAFPGEGFPEDGPVLLAYREDTLRNVVSAAGLGCDLTILPCAVDGAFDNDVSAIPADVPTGQEDQHDADMRAEEAHDFGETRCRRCNRHRLDAAAPCVRA